VGRNVDAQQFKLTVFCGRIRAYVAMVGIAAPVGGGWGWPTWLFVQRSTNTIAQLVFVFKTGLQHPVAELKKLQNVPHQKNPFDRNTVNSVSFRGMKLTWS
jgi:hypothetical protein